VDTRGLSKAELRELKKQCAERAGGKLCPFTMATAQSIVGTLRTACSIECMLYEPEHGCLLKEALLELLNGSSSRPVARRETR